MRSNRYIVTKLDHAIDAVEAALAELSTSDPEYDPLSGIAPRLRSVRGLTLSALHDETRGV